MRHRRGTGQALDLFVPALTGLADILERRRKEDAGRRPARRQASSGERVLSQSARRLHLGSGLLAMSVLADSAVEHYRGSFHNKAMYAPLTSAALTLAASLHGAANHGGPAHRARDTAYALALLTGIAGLGFHVWNLQRRPGGWSWHNLFYGAPVGAPAALSLAGLLGAAAERLRDTPSGERPRLLGLPAGRVLAAVSAGGLAGTVAEVALLHFRGAFQNPAMYLPVSLPPVAAMLTADAAVRPQRRHPIARWWLRLTALLGFAGLVLHGNGVRRNMGGWRNWRKNLLNGPPLPAPPSFTALAIAGLAALGLIEEDRDG
jgi:hypothetical protein